MGDVTRLDTRIKAILGSAEVNITDEQNEAQQRKKADAERIDRERTLAAHVPNHGLARRAVLAGLEETESLALVRDWLDGQSPLHLMLRGESGCGKTAAAVYAVHRWLTPGSGRGGVLWLDADELVSVMLHGYDAENQRLKREIRLVVVDDIGRETKAGFQESLCRLLDRGQERVLMTSNLLKPAMREAYDERLLRRLRDTTYAIDLPPAAWRQPSKEFF